MIVKVYSLSDFERLTDFEQDIFFTWSTRDVGRPLPRVEILQKLYGVEKGGAGLIIHERLQTVTLDDVGDSASPNLYAAIGEVVRARILSFEEEAKRLADTHGCRAVAGTLEPSPVSDALSSILSKRLESLEARMLVVENNYGRALALVEDQVTQVAARTTDQETCLDDHEARLHKVETQELNAIDERLCRLESPSVWEIDRRATAGPSKTSKGSAASTRVFECRHCPHPCYLHVDVAAVVPDRCPYCNSEANWQELRSPGVSK